MTRGPVPKKAIAAAVKVAESRGEVMDMAEFTDSHLDFILFLTRCTVLVRVRRIRAHVTGPEEIDRLFHEDVLGCRRIPQTPVVSREIWVLTPWSCWQFFRILDDRIIEIRRDGTPVLPEVPVEPEAADEAVKLEKLKVKKDPEDPTGPVKPEEPEIRNDAEVVAKLFMAEVPEIRKDPVGPADTAAQGLPATDGEPEDSVRPAGPVLPEIPVVSGASENSDVSDTMTDRVPSGMHQARPEVCTPVPSLTEGPE